MKNAPLDEGLFASMRLIDVRQDVFRNIVSLRESQNLFDDLTDDPAQWALAQEVEDAVKPPPYVSDKPAIHRPFEDAAWFNAIEWPFRHWQRSRFSDGTFGVWYGSETLKTTVYETAYHWLHGLLHDAGFDQDGIMADRKVYTVNCTAALLDCRPALSTHPDLLHKTDYGYPQAVGSRIHREGHPGLLTRSARDASGNNYAIFNPAVLSGPRHCCYLTYRLNQGRILIEKTPGRSWLELCLEDFTTTRV
ncbi:MAG: RES family NAD+ phosphorylase [Burkholderiaceae bacterium]